MKSKTMKFLASSVLAVSLLAPVSAFANPIEVKSNDYKIEQKMNLGDLKISPKFDSDMKVFSNSASPSTTIFGLPQNMGPIDRSLRGLIAAGLIGAGAYGLTTNAMSKELSYTLLGVSVIPIATGASGYCPLYQLFGLDYSF